MTLLVVVIVASVLGAAALLVLLISALSARLMISPPRQPLWTTPGEVGMAYEDVTFRALDGVRLSGWHIPAAQSTAGSAPTVVMVHGWPWNRLGALSTGPLKNLPGSRPVNLMPVMEALHREGFNVLAYDLRNHGKSGASRPMTAGWREAYDILGALDYLSSRGDVDTQRIGLLGFSLGGNTVLYALPWTRGIKAAVAVQPLTSSVFGQRFGRERLGPLYTLVGPLFELFYRLAGGPSTKFIDPVVVARRAGETAVLYVQGKGDKWGSVENVADMVAATPNAVEPIYPDTEERYGGYHYLIDNPQVVTSFFGRYLK